MTSSYVAPTSNSGVPVSTPPHHGSVFLGSYASRERVEGTDVLSPDTGVDRIVYVDLWCCVGRHLHALTVSPTTSGCSYYEYPYENVPPSVKWDHLDPRHHELIERVHMRCLDKAVFGESFWARWPDSQCLVCGFGYDTGVRGKHRYCVRCGSTQGFLATGADDSEWTRV